MKATPNAPSKYGVFLIKKKGHHRAQAVSLLSRASARYRMARSVSDITLETYTVRSMKTYCSILRLFLAYTAYEATVKAAKELRIAGVEKVETNVVLHKPLSVQLRGNQRLKKHLLEHSTNKDLKEKLVRFYGGSFDDLACVGYAIRSVFAHGDLTTTDIGMGLAGDRKLLDAVAQALLDYSDDIFTKCVQKL